MNERDKLKATGFEQVKPTILYTDSQSSVDSCRTLRFKENTKHVNVRINFLRECVNNGVIEIVFIKTDLMVADDGISRFQTVTYRMYICTFVAKRADGRIVLNEEKM